MSVTANPREEISHEIADGQVYEDARTGDELLLVHLDEAVFLLRDRSGSHRLGTRHEFDENVAAGRFSLVPDAEPFASPDNEEMDFAELDGIGEKGATNLHEAGFVTAADCRHASDDEILSVSWVGEKGLASIRKETR